MAPKTGASSGHGGHHVHSHHGHHGHHNGAPIRKEPADSLDLSSFLNCLEQEVGDLHRTYKGRRDDRLEKAFQRVPRSMRRRTASHNAKRLPRRLRQQASRDQARDNTPSVATGLAKRKKGQPASAWVYENTKKRIRLQQEKKLARQGDEGDDAMEDGDVSGGEMGERLEGIEEAPGVDDDRDASLPAGPRPPLPIKNLRLPTHRWQAKRAQLDNPGYLWNTTLVRTPANKTYRMSLRAASLRPGMCVCWDTSYMATIHVRGPAKALGEALASVVEPHLLTPSVRSGARAVDAKLPRSFRYQPQSASTGIELGGPGNCGAMTLFYNPAAATTTTAPADDEVERAAFLRVHPTIFSHVWTTLNNEIARKQLPVFVRDFRLEIGSIDVTGSAAIETLAATLYPYDTKASPMEPQGREFLKLRKMDTTALAGASGAMLALNIQDPRLDEPQAEAESGTSTATNGQSYSSPSNPNTTHSSFNFQDWPDAQAERRPSGLFDTMARHSATKQLPQAILDKRRGKLATGELLLVGTNPQCRPVPVILAAAAGASSVPAMADPHAASGSSTASPTWTLLAPRACINTIWQRLNLQHLCNGQRPMCAGVEEERHMALERGRPWFPADFPGTPTGWDWELQSRRRQEKEWNEKPTAKRTQWTAVDLGAAGKGELGSGFACDWEYLFAVDAVQETLAADTPADDALATVAGDIAMDVCDDDGLAAGRLYESVQFEALRPRSKAMPAIVRDLQHATWTDIRAAVQNVRLQKPVAWRSPYQLMTISVQLLWGGVPDARARVYRLPACDGQARARWLALADTKTQLHKTGANHVRPAPPRRMPAEADMVTRKKLLAQSLLETRLPYPRLTATDGVEFGDDLHPPIPGRDDLIGFLTSGAHRFQSGKGFGIGHVSAAKLVEAIVAADSEGEGEGINRGARFCIVRNAGEQVGHLARWTPISN